MQNKYSSKLGIWISLLVILLVLSLGAYATNAPEAKPPVPVFRKIIMLQVEFYSTLAEVRTACLVKPGKLSNGCTYNDGRGSSRVVMLSPKNWCDWSRMRTLAHEVMHALGWMHSTAYQIRAVKPPVWLVNECVPIP